jgi:hypothetical protein
VAVAAGLRALIGDLEEAFPDRRLRVVIPQRAAAVERIESELATMNRPEGGVYGRDYYRHVWSSLNYIPAIGEGMALVDLSGLRAVPVFLGVRFLPDRGPLRLFVGEVTRDLADNHGSSYRGPKSFFYEAQETLRSNAPARAREDREKRICQLLSDRNTIDEVILYEAADWTYYLPMPESDVSGWGFLDRCEVE